MTEKGIFINHVINTVEQQMEENGAIMIGAVFNPKTFDGIRMYLKEIAQIARERRLDIEEDLVPNTLLVIKF